MLLWLADSANPHRLGGAHWFQRFHVVNAVLCNAQKDGVLGSMDPKMRCDLVGDLFFIYQYERIWSRVISGEIDKR